MDEKRRLLRHFLATLAYRTNKAIEGAPPDFAVFSPGAGVRTPLEILHHMTGLLRWIHNLMSGEAWVKAPKPAWEEAVAQFYHGLHVVDHDLEAGTEAGGVKTLEQLLQGPFADAMTHAGQLALLRRLAGSAVPGQDFTLAEIQLGVFAGDPQAR